jgi:tetratricopeptide (TPR) repeat protein
MAVRTAMLAALLELDRDDEAGLEADEVLRQVRSGSGTGRQCQEALIQLAKASVRLNRGEQAMALLDQLPVALEPAVHALALSARSAALRELGRVDEARELNRVALAQPDLDEDTRFPAARHPGTHGALWRPPAARARARRAGAGDRAAQRSSTLHVVRAQGLRGALLVQVGDAAGAESALLEAASQAALLRLVSHQRSLLGNLCVLYSAQSRPDAVLAARCRVLAAAATHGSAHPSAP